MSLFRRSLLALCLSSAATAAWAKPELVQAWQVADLAVPESVLYHQAKDQEYLFVSQIDGNDPSAADGKGGIALISADGKLVNKDWVTGLHAPKGMAVKDGILYVSDITDLVAIDIAKAKVVGRYPVEGAMFLNDVAVHQGDVYVSDSRTAKVHKLVGDKLETFLEGQSGANGLASTAKGLLVGAGKELRLVDADKKITLVASDFAEGIDGIEPLQSGGFVISCWPGLVYHVDAKGQLTQLIDSRADKVNTADIGYIASQKLVLVPNFFKNTVTAYQLKE